MERGDGDRRPNTKGVYTMNKQKTASTAQDTLLNDDTREFVEIVSGLPYDFRQKFFYMAVGFAAALEMKPEPPQSTTHAAALARAL